MLGICLTVQYAPRLPLQWGGGVEKKYMSAKDINGSHIFTPTYLRLNSFTQGGKVLHAPTLSHVSSWRTVEESYLMPCLMQRGHRNRLQNNSLKKSLNREHNHITHLLGRLKELNGEELCVLFRQLNVAVLFFLVIERVLTLLSVFRCRVCE